MLVAVRQLLRRGRAVGRRELDHGRAGFLLPFHRPRDDALAVRGRHLRPELALHSGDVVTEAGRRRDRSRPRVDRACRFLRGDAVVTVSSAGDQRQCVEDRDDRSLPSHACGRRGRRPGSSMCEISRSGGHGKARTRVGQVRQPSSFMSDDLSTRLPDQPCLQRARRCRLACDGWRRRPTQVVGEGRPYVSARPGRIGSPTPRARRAARRR